MRVHPAELRDDIRQLAAAGVNDCEIARRLELPRTTVRDIRRRPAEERCPRCWRRTKPIRFAAGDYAELLGLYLGDGHIAGGPRTQHLRISMDARHAQLVAETRCLIERCLPANSVSLVRADAGATVVVSAYSMHLGCLFPQHGPGKKHERPIVLEPWQVALLDAAPWSFLRGCVHSDGCFFINRTGRYRYLSVDFYNLSADILDLFERACELVGAARRRYDRHIRIYDRTSVAAFAAFVGTKR